MAASLFLLGFLTVWGLGTVRVVRLIIPQEEGGQLLHSRNAGMDGPVFVMPGGDHGDPPCGHGLVLVPLYDSIMNKNKGKPVTSRGLSVRPYLVLDVKVIAPHHLPSKILAWTKGVDWRCLARRTL